MPCYRCGVRQTDPERGKSPWRRGVARDQLVLICPACQESTDWTADLEHCARCRSAHLIRRLGQVECLDCGLVREPEAALVPVRAGEAGISAQPQADSARADSSRAGSSQAGSSQAGRSQAGSSQAGSSQAGSSRTSSSRVGSSQADSALADEVGRALDRLLGRH